VAERINYMNRVQEIQFELMKLASFNDFDGERVVEDLINFKELWRGAVMDRGYCDFVSEPRFVSGINLIKLRDIDSDYWSVDTLFILPKPGKEDSLEELANTWKADEVGWVGGKEACKMLGSYSGEREENSKQVLRIWWD
jgi:hypothetical protein